MTTLPYIAKGLCKYVKITNFEVEGLCWIIQVGSVNSQGFLSEEGRIIRMGEKDVMTEVGGMVTERDLRMLGFEDEERKP